MAADIMPSPTSTLHADEQTTKHVHTGPSSAASSVKEVKAAKTPKAAPEGVALQAPLEIPRWRFWAVFISLLFSVFLFALGTCDVAFRSPTNLNRSTHPRNCHTKNHR